MTPSSQSALRKHLRTGAPGGLHSASRIERNFKGKVQVSRVTYSFGNFPLRYARNNLDRN